MALVAGCASADSFAKLDTYRDGSDSRSEFDNFMKQEVFARIDANHDAKVTRQEWKNVNPKVSDAKFRKADRNGDQAITRNEAVVGGVATGLITDSWGGVAVGAAMGGLVGGKIARNS